MFLAELPENSGDDSEKHEHKKDANETGREPILALALIQDDLHASEAEADETDANVIDAKAALDACALHVRRIADQDRGQQERNDAHRDIDIENPAPRKIIGDPAAEPRADG